MSDSEQVVCAEASEESAQSVAIDVISEENGLLKQEMENLRAENLIWRELIVEMREMVVQSFQGFPHSRPYDRIRKLLAQPAAMAAEVAKRRKPP